MLSAHPLFPFQTIYNLQQKTGHRILKFLSRDRYTRLIRRRNNPLCPVPSFSPVQTERMNPRAFPFYSSFCFPLSSLFQYRSMPFCGPQMRLSSQHTLIDFFLPAHTFCPGLGVLIAVLNSPQSFHIAVNSSTVINERITISG